MKKKLLTILLAFALALSLGVSAAAYGDYALCYDNYSYLDEVFLADYTSTLEAMSERYSTELRVDIYYNKLLEGGAAAVADNLRSQYGYGHPDTGNGLLLFMNMDETAGDLALSDWTIIGYGADALSGAYDGIAEYLAPYTAPEAWTGGHDSDLVNIENILANYASGADNFLSSLALAPSSGGGENWQSGEAALGYFTDMAGLLSESDRATLEQKAAELSARYECGIYAVTVDDYTDYNGASVYEAAKTIYRDNSLGYGGEKSGVLLLLSMAERDYSLIAYGYGNVAFTDYGKGLVEDVFLDDFRYDDWYTGFSDYIDRAGAFLYAARSGTPVDVDTAEAFEEPLDPATTIIIALVIGCVIAGIVCGIMALRMRSAVKAVEADEYIPAGGADLRVRQDIFTHTTESRVKVEKESSGGTSIDSGGFSGSSGKF